MTAHQDTVDPASSHCGAGRCGSIDFSSGWYIVGTVLAFVFFWPLGLAMLAWAFHREIRRSSWWQRLRSMRVPAAQDLGDLGGFLRRRPSNEALAEYLQREQQRLRDEQQKLDELVRAFEAFKAAERKSRDRQDFESFMRQRDAGGTDGQAPQV